VTTLQTSPLALSEDAQDLLFRTARTANAFTDEPVSDVQLQAVHDLVKNGPTALNAQPLRVALLRSEQARATVLRHLSEGNRAKTAGAPLVAVLGYDLDFHDELPRVFPHAPGIKRSSPRSPPVTAPRATTPTCRRPTSSWACAPPASRRGRWAATTPTASTRSSSPTAGPGRSWS